MASALFFLATSQPRNRARHSHSGAAFRGRPFHARRGTKRYCLTRTLQKHALNFNVINQLLKKLSGRDRISFSNQ
jgi:hypothetical protein